MNRGAGTARAPASLAAVLLVVAVLSVLRYVVFYMAEGAFYSATAFTFYALAGAASISFVLFQPFKLLNRSRLNENNAIKLVAAAGCLMLSAFITIYCLKIMGGLRAMVLEFADVIMVTIVAIFFGTKRTSGPRPLLLALVGILLMLWYSPPPTEYQAAVISERVAEAAMPRRLLLATDEDAELLGEREDEALFPSPESKENPRVERAIPSKRSRHAAAIAAASRVKKVLEAHTTTSVVLAGLLMLGASWLDTIRRRLSKAVAESTGLGHRRTHAFVLLAAAGIMAPLAFFRWVFGDEPEPGQIGANSSVLWFLLAAVVFGTVVFEFGEGAVELSPALAGALVSVGHSNEPNQQPKTKGVGSFETALLRGATLILSGAVGMVCCAVANDPGVRAQLTASFILGFFIFVPSVMSLNGVEATRMVETIFRRLDSSGGMRLKDREGLESRTGILSYLRSAVGGLRALALGLFESGGEPRLPQHTDTLARAVSDEYHTTADLSPWKLTKRVMKHVWDDKNSRKIFLFLLINFSFMFVEITVGWLNNSLGLISDAGHMFFDNASLFIGLYASYMSRWKADGTYTYGYSRYEVVAGFVNAIFLVFVALSVVFEALERLWEPPEIHSEHLLTVSVLGLLVNLIGLVFFHEFAHAHGHGGGDHGHAHGSAPSTPALKEHDHTHDSHGHSHDDHGHSHNDHGHNHDEHGHDHGEHPSGREEHQSTNENMHGVYLHVLADALGSVGVITSSLLIKYFGWYLADPVASIFISGLILLSVVPLVQATAGPLLSRVPESHEQRFWATLQQVSRLPDVVSVDQAHFWKHHADILVSTMHVSIKDDADDQKVLRVVRKMLTGVGIAHSTIQIEKESSHNSVLQPRASEMQARNNAGPPVVDTAISVN